jgi:hypothetical protein
MNRYDYYVEPCQLCIQSEKNGQQDRIENCTWCHAPESHYSDSDDYPGSIIKVQHAGEGYRFHQAPHPERHYYLNDELLDSVTGQEPDDSKMDTNDLIPPIVLKLALLYTFVYSHFLMCSLERYFSYSLEDFIARLEHIITGSLISLIAAAIVHIVAGLVLLTAMGFTELFFKSKTQHLRFVIYGPVVLFLVIPLVIHVIG